MINYMIRQPRYHDRKVLLARSKLRQYNEIYFTEAKSMPGIYWLPASEIIKHPLGSNGVIPVFEVPLTALEQWPGDREVVL